MSNVGGPESKTTRDLTLVEVADHGVCLPNKIRLTRLRHGVVTWGCLPLAICPCGSSRPAKEPIHAADRGSHSKLLNVWNWPLKRRGTVERLLKCSRYAQDEGVSSSGTYNLQTKGHPLRVKPNRQTNSRVT